MSEFEVLLISIDWEKPHKVREIIQSKNYLKASSIKNNQYEYDIVLYTKEEEHYFQFAIKTNHLPFLKKNNDSRITIELLYNIQDDLWIIKEEWRIGERGIGYHYCPSINTIGKIELEIIENSNDEKHFVTIDINSNIEELDFEQLKNDFEGELWNLITSNKSKVTSDKIELRYCDKIFKYPENKSIIEFIKAFDQIVKNPKRELSFTKENRRSEKVIPISETFRKLSTSGSTVLLPSKSVFENYDIYENRLVCFMFHNILLIVSNNLKYTSLQIERLQTEIRILNEKVVALQNRDPKVNSEIVNQDITFQQQRVNKLQDKWTFINNKIHSNADVTCKKIRVNIKYPYRYDKNSYWCTTNECSYCLISFPDNILRFIKESEVFYFEASCTMIEEKVKTSSNKEFPKYEINLVRKIESGELVTERDILGKQRQNLNILKENNWSQFSILSDNEKEKYIKESTNQIMTIKKKIERINSQIKNIEDFNNEQFLIKPMIERRYKHNNLNKIRWKNFQGFKPSMTFIQNIVYRNALRYYKEILKSEGIDIKIFDLYENITSYGIREMPQVYELWCLVTIIKVLEESFHFSHDSKDLTSLLKSINPNNQRISDNSKINFVNSLAGRQVILHYQKVISNGKRPDFILEISSSGKKINIILDSKFKNYNYKQSIIYETISMRDKYRDTNNFVFILHPCKNGTFQGRNIMYTNHGGEKIFYNNEKQQNINFPFHEYGYVELKPNHTDNLKKLVAMSLEYLIEQSRNAKKEDGKIDPKPENNMFCINCGRTNISMDSFPRGENRHFYKCICNEANCGHEISIDYCWNCKTKLFKHGSYWDYHLESNWSSFDIRCPNCGMTMADRPQTFHN